MKGKSFINYCTQQRDNSVFRKLLDARGISLETAQLYNLGYNPKFWRCKGAAWGHEEECRVVSLPAGLVIPSYEPQSGLLLGIKIRKIDPAMPKYHQVIGSSDALTVFDYKPGSPVVVLESELDSILLTQEAGDLVWIIALGGSSKKPDLYLDGLIRRSPKVIHVPDYDDAGAASIPFWAKYSNSKLYCTPREKSVGDAYLTGLDLRNWIAQIIVRGNHEL